MFPSTFDTNGLVVREAAACGLASVLVRGSCAAEDITDGRNGFLIEETAASMARLLKTLCPDLAHLHQVGEHAMNEIYLSWKDCVAAAYARYGELLERTREGGLKGHGADPADLLLAATAHGMSERDKLRRLGREWFQEVKETAEGMMDWLLGD